MAYSAAIFDLDGTLLDTLDDLSAAVNHALALYGLPLQARDDICRAVGNGIRHLVHACVPRDIDPALEEQVFEAFRASYLEHAADETRPYPGIPALLRHLRTRGIRCAVISNKADDAVQQLVDRFFPGELDVALGEREAEGIRKKPAPDTLDAVIDALGFKKSEVVYVGDSEVDIQTAANAHVDCIAVAWGFRDPEHLLAEGAPALAETVDQLEAMIVGEE